MLYNKSMSEGKNNPTRPTTEGDARWKSEYNLVMNYKKPYSNIIMKSPTGLKLGRV